MSSPSHHPNTRVDEVVHNDLMQSIGSALEVAGENWVSLQKCLEGNRHRLDIDRTFQLYRAAEERLTPGEHFLAARQLSDDGCRKHKTPYGFHAGQYLSPHARPSIADHHRHYAYGDNAACPKQCRDHRPQNRAALRQSHALPRWHRTSAVAQRTAESIVGIGPTVRIQCKRRCPVCIPVRLPRQGSSQVRGAGRGVESGGRDERRERHSEDYRHHQPHQACDQALWNRKPSASPAQTITTVVTSIRTASATRRESTPDARCTGRTHSRASNPSARSRMRPIAPADDPVIVATTATIGTLPNSASCPVIVEIWSAEHRIQRHQQQDRHDERLDDRCQVAAPPD